MLAICSAVAYAPAVFSAAASMCTVTIATVNGIVPPGGSNPTQLQVTGTLTSCSSNNVVVTAKDAVTGAVIAGPSPATPVANPVTGRFVVIVPIIQTNIACGSAITVSAECDQNPQCQTTISVTALPCCVLGPVFVSGVVPPGALGPVALVVKGTAFGCFGNQVTISVTSPPPTSVLIAGPVTAMVDAATGGYSAQLSLSGSVDCDGEVEVAVQCSQNPASCPAFVRRAKIDCGICPRAQVSATPGQCTGTPPKQPITLNATISIPAGAKACFQWLYGDGTSGTVFLIDNTAGTATTQYTHSEPPHLYAPGTYVATLQAVNCATGLPVECPKITLAVTAGCGGCPTITLTADPPGPCVNGNQSVTFHATVNGVPSSGCVLEWNFAGTPGGAFFVSANGPLAPVTHSFAAPATGTTTYTVTLTIISPPGCPAATIQVTVGPCPCCIPTPTITCTVTGCAPTSAKVTFDVLSWNWPPGCTVVPIQATSFQWTISDSSGNPLYHQTSVQPHIDTAANWIDQSTGVSGPVQLGTGGNFSVAVVALISGVTCGASQGTAPFQVPPCCPQLIGLTASVVPGSPCTVLFTAQVNPSNASATYDWSFMDGTTATTSTPQTTHTFPVNTTTTGASVTLKAPNCTDQVATASITLTGCTCPSVGMPVATVTGCVGPGSTAAVSLATSVSPPAAATSIKWTVTIPAGTPFTKTTSGVTTTDGVADGPWLNTSSGATGSLDLTSAGSYAVSVSASGPGIPAGCPPPAPLGFTVPACPTSGGGGGTVIGCVLLRWFSVFFFIVAGFFFDAFFCLGPLLPPYLSWVQYVWLGIAIAAAVIGIVLLIIWLLLSICTGKPCAWGLLLAWQVLIGYGAVTLYFVPCCQWALVVGLIALILGIILLIIWWVVCKRTLCQVLVEMMPIAPTVIFLISIVALIFGTKCLSSVVGFIISGVNLILTIAAAACLASGTGPSGN